MGKDIEQRLGRDPGGPNIHSPFPVSLFHVSRLQYFIWGVLVTKDFLPIQLEKSISTLLTRVLGKLESTL